MIKYTDIKVSIDIEFGQTCSDFMNAQRTGGLYPTPYNQAIASCLYLSLMDQEEPTEETPVSKKMVQNGIRLFNSLTKSTVPITF